MDHYNLVLVSLIPVHGFILYRIILLLAFYYGCMGSQWEINKGYGVVAANGICMGCIVELYNRKLENRYACTRHQEIQSDSRHYLAQYMQYSYRLSKPGSNSQNVISTINLIYQRTIIDHENETDRLCHYISQEERNTKMEWISDIFELISGLLPNGTMEFSIKYFYRNSYDQYDQLYKALLSSKSICIQVIII